MIDIKLWVDDIRTPPDASWTWVQTSSAAIWYLKNWYQYDGNWLDISLDHDLGGDDTTRPIILWLIENRIKPWIDSIKVHSANPVGISWLEGMIERYLCCEDCQANWHTCDTCREEFTNE